MACFGGALREGMMLAVSVVFVGVGPLPSAVAVTLHTLTGGGRLSYMVRTHTRQETWLGRPA